jgi:hypothetical protein
MFFIALAKVGTVLSKGLLNIDAFLEARKIKCKALLML